MRKLWIKSLEKVHKIAKNAQLNYGRNPWKNPRQLSERISGQFRLKSLVEFRDFLKDFWKESLEKSQKEFRKEYKDGIRKDILEEFRDDSLEEFRLKSLELFGKFSAGIPERIPGRIHG